MILLEVKHPIVYELLMSKFEQWITSGKAKSSCERFADFDDVLYEVACVESESLVKISISLKFFAELQKHGAEELPRREYGSNLQAQPDQGFNVTLVYPLDDFPKDLEKAGEIAEKASFLRRNCFASVFERYFQLQQNEDTGQKDAVIHFRKDETMFVQAKRDRVTVIFSTRFDGSEDDKILGKIFLQEFGHGRPTHGGAPQVLFSIKTPPAELSGHEADTISGEDVGYITIVLFSRHTNPNARDNTINLIHTLRNYLHYHLKCSKAYIHSRMRAKTAYFLKVLNKAKPEQPKGAAKTIGGKFVSQMPNP